MLKAGWGLLPLRQELRGPERQERESLLQELVEPVFVRQPRWR
jgi:hypothetical protein